jgi:hypothetical protein
MQRMIADDSVQMWHLWCGTHVGTPEDIGSGNVLSHTGVYDHVEKGVLRCPWRMAPYPFVFTDNTSQESISRRFVTYLAHRNVLTLAALLLAAMSLL